jgi:hypothetical protein
MDFKDSARVCGLGHFRKETCVGLQFFVLIHVAVFISENSEWVGIQKWAVLARKDRGNLRKHKRMADEENVLNI